MAIPHPKLLYPRGKGNDWRRDFRISTPTKLTDWTKELEKWWKEVFGKSGLKVKDAPENRTGSLIQRK